MFSREKASQRLDMNPGPANYFQDGVYAPTSKKNVYEFPR